MNFWHVPSGLLTLYRSIPQHAEICYLCAPTCVLIEWSFSSMIQFDTARPTLFSGWDLDNMLFSLSIIDLIVDIFWDNREALTCYSPQAV